MDKKKILIAREEGADIGRLKSCIGRTCGDCQLFEASIGGAPRVYDRIKPVSATVVYSQKPGGGSKIKADGLDLAKYLQREDPGMYIIFSGDLDTKNIGLLEVAYPLINFLSSDDMEGLKRILGELEKGE